MQQRQIAGFHVGKYDIGPKTLPTSPLTEVDSTVYVYELGGINTTAGDLYVWIYDRQDTPIYLLKQTRIPAGGAFALQSRQGRPFYGGLVWYASGTGIDGWIVGDFQGQETRS